MRFIQSEKIVLSQSENNTFYDFFNLITGLARGTRNPNTERAILKIQELVSDLWEGLEVEE